jgi:hypothetical protein
LDVCNDVLFLVIILYQLEPKTIIIWVSLPVKPCVQWQWWQFRSDWNRNNDMWSMFIEWHKGYYKVLSLSIVCIRYSTIKTKETARISNAINWFCFSSNVCILIIMIECITTYAISAYHHYCCEYESRSDEVYSIPLYVMKFVSDLACGRSVVSVGYSGFLHQ